MRFISLKEINLSREIKINAFIGLINHGISLSIMQYLDFNDVDFIFTVTTAL